MQKMAGLTTLCILFSFRAFTQDALYVAAKTGLNMRENPNPTARVIAKIPYGTHVTIGSSLEPAKRIEVEGFTGYWKKVTYNNQTGFIIDAYLLPLPPPVSGTQTLKDYFRQVSTPFSDSLVVAHNTSDNSDEGESTLVKQIYKNGCEWHALSGYEYNSMAYFLPRFTMQQAFVLIRLIPEFKSFVEEKDPYIISGKKIKKNALEHEYKVEKEVYGDTPWIERIKIMYEEGALYNFEMFHLDHQIVIFYGAGV